ncbi:hypothetical protein P886_3722 [Alteromonadaceae bacterium 2753L.S.0a.02]|nr:hypothetical protein P886_3722 [Alteromonadaceae bacterium 2753L.S.0a.02]
MILVHATKKLTAKLPKESLINAKDSGPAETLSPLGAWHANIVTLRGKDCVLFAHDSTRFPVILLAVGSRVLSDLGWFFEDGFMNTLLKLDASQEQLDAAANTLAPLRFDNTTDRSVVSTMTQMVLDLEFILDNESVAVEDLSAYRTGAFLADRPCKVKGKKDYFWPHKSMLEFLEKLSKSSPSGKAAGAKPEKDPSKSIASKTSTSKTSPAKTSTSNIIPMDKYR